MMRTKNAQVMFEFLLVISLVSLLFLALSSFIFQSIREKEKEITSNELELLGKSLQEKMFTVSNMKGGLHLDISLPQLINKKNYSMDIINNHLYVSQGDFEIIYLLPDTSGNILSRSFTLVKEGGVVVIQ